MQHIFTVKLQPWESEKIQPIFSCTRLATEHLVQPCWFRVKVQPQYPEKTQRTFSWLEVATDNFAPAMLFQVDCNIGIGTWKENNNDGTIKTALGRNDNPY